MDFIYQIKKTFSKHYRFLILLIIVGFILPLLLLWYLGIIYYEIYRLAELVISTWAILTAYIILYYQIFRTEESKKKEISIVINQLEDLIRFIHGNYEDLIKKQDTTEHQIVILRRYYEEPLRKLNYFFGGPTEIKIFTSEATYFINPVDITKRDKDKIINISTNNEEIEQLIKNLKE